MAIQLIRENIDVESIAGEGAAQALIEGSVMLPGAARDAAALYADARMEMGNVEAQADRVAMDGQVFFTLLYAAGEDGVRAVETAMSFSHIIDVPGAGPKMDIEVQGAIEHAEAEISGGRATLRAIAKLRARAGAKQSISCVGEIEGAKDLQTLTAYPQSLCTVASGENQLMLEERFELPYGLESEEALFAQARASIERMATLDDRVELYGQVYLDAYHRTNMFDRPLARTKHVLPFTISVNLPGATASEPAQAEVEVRGLSVQLQHEDDARFLACELTLLAAASAQEKTQIAALEDAYTASDEMLEVVSATIPMRSSFREENGTDGVKAVLSLEEGQPPMGAVLAAFARPAMWELSTDSRTHAEGVLEVTVVYEPSGGERPVALTQEAPFRTTYDFSLSEDAWPVLSVEDAEAIQITGDRLELKCNVRLAAQVYETTDYTVAVDAELAQEGREIPGGITLYFVQPGDTLWTVAKQFRTTRESLTMFNPEVEELTGNEKILLYKRKTVV